MWTNIAMPMGWKPTVRPQWPPSETVCLPTANKSHWPGSFHLLPFSANKSSPPLRWHELFLADTPLNQTRLCLECGQSQHNKNHWTNRSTWTRHTVRLMRGILSPFGWCLFVTLASALHHEAFTGHITFLISKFKTENLKKNSLRRD